MSDVVTQTKPYDILVTGASGFIGKKLLNKLTDSGFTVTAMSRSNYPDTENVKRVQADAFDVDSLTKATAGIETAFYLLHSMEGSKKEWAEFAHRENKGNAVKKREETHKMADANRAFSHFRW